jgi:molybdate transport system substrate-binding protein
LLRSPRGSGSSSNRFKAAIGKLLLDSSFFSFYLSAAKTELFMRKKIKFLTFMSLLGLLASCGADLSGNQANPQQELIVFAASSLTDAFLEISEAFEQVNPDTAVILNFASSSQLAIQLTEGAPADIFASANEQQMATAVAAGRIDANDTVTFATNRLTILTPADNPAQITELADLSRPGIRLVLAVPGVPVRQYTDEIVAHLGTDFSEAFYANLVSEEKNVRQVAAKAALGEADAVIVYTSDLTPDIAGRVQQIMIPDAQNVTAVYPIAPLADAMQPDLARQFIEFVRSPAGQTILANWGLGGPGD